MLKGKMDTNQHLLLLNSTMFDVISGGCVFKSIYWHLSRHPPRFSAETLRAQCAIGFDCILHFPVTCSLLLEKIRTKIKANGVYVPFAFSILCIDLAKEEKGKEIASDFKKTFMRMMMMMMITTMMIRLIILQSSSHGSHVIL